MRHQLAHVGWITTDIAKFEAFWCDILGFQNVYINQLDQPMAKQLFGVDCTPSIRRYKHSDWNVDIEIHCFEEDELVSRKLFQQPGINHICLNTGKRVDNSREKFLASLPAMVKKLIYKNPGGWENIFIRDFENNWIELREEF